VSEEVAVFSGQTAQSAALAAQDKRNFSVHVDIGDRCLRQLGWEDLTSPTRKSLQAPFRQGFKARGAQIFVLSFEVDNSR